MNKRSISVFLILAFAALFIGSALAAETSAEKDARMQWWRDARFGLFIHFGLYAVPAGEWGGKNTYGEWIRDGARIPVDVYEEFVGKFNPSRFDAGAWVRAAKEAGMKYIVITSKHHDGFGLFNSKETEFDIMSTPFGRDLLKELSSACERQNIRLCFYYSIMDWDNPDYLPRRSWEPKVRKFERFGDFDRYVDYMKAQLRDLLTNYGRIGVLWFDGEWENTWNEEHGWDLYNYVRSLQPNIIVNNRVGASRNDMQGFSKSPNSPGDFATPEQEIPAAGYPGVDWESCMTMNDHWGYNKADRNWKSSRDLIRMLADSASKGGNFLLNVGPTAEGVFPDASLERLADIGRWMRVNGESIYGTEAGPFIDLSWGRSTQNKSGKATRIYLHVFDWPGDGRLIIPNTDIEPAAAYLLASGNRGLLEFERRGKAIEIRVPDRAPDADDSVVVLETGGGINPCAAPKIQPDSRNFPGAIDVTITPAAGVEGTRYTLNGQEPTVASPRVSGPVHLTETTVVSARSFRGGIPCGETVRETYTKTGEEGVHPALKGVTPRNGLHYAYYEGDWNTLPQLEKMSPVADGLADRIDLKPQKRHEHYALEFDGLIRAPKTGVFTFFVRSDDGSRLWIDDVLVVDNDGSHGAAERSGSIALEDGPHTIRVRYFNKVGGEELQVSWTVPGRGKEIIPESALFHR